MEFVKLHKNLKKKKAQNYHKNQDLSIWAQQVLNLNTYNGPDDAHKARSTLNHTSLHYTYPFFPFKMHTHKDARLRISREGARVCYEHSLDMENKAKENHKHLFS